MNKRRIAEYCNPTFGLQIAAKDTTQGFSLEEELLLRRTISLLHQDTLSLVGQAFRPADRKAEALPYRIKTDLCPR